MTNKPLARKVKDGDIKLSKFALSKEVEDAVRTERETVLEKIRCIFYQFSDSEQDFYCNQRVLKLRNDIFEALTQPNNKK